MANSRPCFRFEIDNFSQKIKTSNNRSEQKHAIESEIFGSGGCDWFLVLNPKGDDNYCHDHISLYLYVGDEYLLQTGWKRSARYYFAMLNQSGKVLYRSSVQHTTFCAKALGWGFPKTLPLSNFEEERFLENDKLIIEVYINVDKKEEIVDIEGFQVFASQAASVRKMFAEHPDIAKDFKPKNKVVKTEYMNVLLNLIKTLEKTPRIYPWYIQNKACSDLTELMDAGFKLDFLKPMLGLEVSLGRKKASDPGVSPEKQLEERFKNILLRGSSSKMDLVGAKLTEDMSLEQKANGDWSRVQILEDKIKKLEWDYIGLCNLSGRLEDVSEESRESYEDVKCQVKKMEKSFTNLELIVSNLTAELDTKKAESSVDEFLLVDNVD